MRFEIDKFTLTAVLLSVVISAMTLYGLSESKKERARLRESVDQLSEQMSVFTDLCTKDNAKEDKK